MKIVRITIGVLSAMLLLFLGYTYFELMGCGGWQPDRNSVYAERARKVNRALRTGMSRAEVRAIFRNDVKAFPADSIEDTSNAYWGQNVPTWLDETDLFIFEPRPHFWNSFDTGWTVRVRFQHGKLAEHRIQLSDVGGP
jgi:hypothetical protein